MIEPTPEQAKTLAELRTRGWHIGGSDSGYVNLEFHHDDFDGAPDAGDIRCGHGDTWQHVIDDILFIEDCG